MKTWIRCVGLVLLFWVAPISAKSTEPVRKWIEVKPGVELYAEILPGDPRLTPIVLLNGLTQDTDHWQRMLPELKKTGATIILVDGFQQGRSLDRQIKQTGANFKVGLRPVAPPLLGEKFIWGAIPPLISETPIQLQSDLLDRLLKKLKVKQKVMVVGLSYGGGLALDFAVRYSTRIEKVVLMAPYVSPLPQQDQWVKSQVAIFKASNPHQNFSDDEIYDYFLRDLVYRTYHLAEPSILKWGAFQPVAASEMVRGIRHIKAHELVQQLKPGSLHLVIAGGDQYVPESLMRDFWNQAPKGVPASFVKIDGAEHKINETSAEFAALWVRAIHQNHPSLRRGREFLGDPEHHRARAVEDGEVIELRQVGRCENLFLRK